jgi:cupin 2 domain-containing protein
MKPDNIFAGVPTDIPKEIFETIAASGSVKIERIVSRGQTTPEGSWYDQELNEWVIVLKGSAEVLFDGEPQPVTLMPGDNLLIPAHRRHRVTRTDDKGPTIWVAVHFA